MTSGYDAPAAAAAAAATQATTSTAATADAQATDVGPSTSAAASPSSPSKKRRRSATTPDDDVETLVEPGLAAAMGFAAFAEAHPARRRPGGSGDAVTAGPSAAGQGRGRRGAKGAKAAEAADPEMRDVGAKGGAQGDKGWFRPSFIEDPWAALLADITVAAQLERDEENSGHTKHLREYKSPSSVNRTIYA
ncbi:hypothetical protein BDY21DRAFT_391574 [Lineolata rhizophorae]|uniref:Uncharacterized protein n=1 Tax=Lineolata rhizophorae TaxID=578093 RepID=A0A6A6P0K1_9PEZI|nr:hypothetical protein BDY21DRAFT_391574 [Lineolata rhizophorae]